MSREYVLQPFRPAVDFSIDYQAELNEQQHAAVTAPPGPSLVIAGAGAGKTRALIYRVAFLLEQGIPPDRIMLLTFTNKAAREMMRRVFDLLGKDLKELWGGTFHSLGNRFLRRHAERVGFRSNFTILDREDARDLVKTCLADEKVEVTSTRYPKADVLVNIFSLSVNTTKSIGQVLAEQYDHFVDLTPQIEALARTYHARKQAANLMDFDDLLVQWRRLLQEHPDVLEGYQSRFQFLLVDEYQDTNLIQAEIVDLLAARHQNIMVVGDDSQSIYSWRGANFANILRFTERYPKATTYKIEVNYRSTPEILTLANAAIAPNKLQIQKELTPARAAGVKPVLVACVNAGQQAAFIAQRLLELREEGTELHRMAVLYRSHFHALELQLELTQRNIPFVITSGIRFFEQAHIKDVAAYLKLVNNSGDELSFKRIVQMLPGIGAKGAEKLWQLFRGYCQSGAGPGDQKEAAVQKGKRKEAEAKLPVTAAMQRCAEQVPKKSVRAWADLVISMSQVEDPGLRNHPGRMIETIVEAVYEDYLMQSFTNHQSRLEDLEQLANFAGQFQSVDDFLSQLSLLTNLEAETAQEGSQSQDEERLRLSTIHQAKGLEFDVVFVLMLCDGLFPSERSLDRLEGEEEERRLFYVAVTRARNELYLSYPLLRTMPGGGRYPQNPSRFVSDLPEELYEEWNLLDHISF